MHPRRRLREQSTSSFLTLAIHARDAFGGASSDWPQSDLSIDRPDLALYLHLGDPTSSSPLTWSECMLDHLLCAGDEKAKRMLKTSQ